MSARISLISAKQYLKLATDAYPRLVTLDCTWYPAGKNGHDEYLHEHIAGARYFDFNKISTKSDYPHMMPRSFSEFKIAAAQEGITRSDYIVVYDQTTYLAAPRVAWMLATFGHPNIFLLDNYKEYKRLGGKTESGPSLPAPVVEQYNAPGDVSNNAREPEIGEWLYYDDLLALVRDGGVDQYNLVDARAAGRFAGTAPEPRPGLKSGHIRGSKNIAFGEVVDESGHFKTKSELLPLLEERGVDPAKPTIVLCGSGVTACVVKTALDQALGGSALIYDGSWSEWGLIAPDEFIEK